MGNLLQYTDKSKTIDNKLASLLNQIEYDYQNGNIRTETEYYYRIKNMLSEFYDSLTKPTFKFRPAISTPISGEYNAMITESYNDMEYIIKDCESLSKLISQSFTDAELSRTMLMNELTYLSKKIMSIRESVVNYQPAGTVVFTELFNDLEYVGNLNSSDTCRIDTTNGILTLRQQVTTGDDITKIEIDNEVSNGFPGNTHCVDVLNGEMHFIGQEGLRNSLNHVIRRTTDDVWFEFELFSIDDKVRKECNSFGFEYDEGISWINNKDVLRLKLIIYMQAKSVSSWITLTPYLSDVKGVKNCYLEKCEIITQDNTAYEVATNQVFDDVLVFPCPPKIVERVELTFVQPHKYRTNIGHFYYSAADTTSMSAFQNTSIFDAYTRVDGENPSVNLLGPKYNPTTQWIDYQDTETELLSTDYVKEKLFTPPASTLDKKAGQEILEAYRYMIGIKNIEVTSNLYKEKSYYISKAFETNDIITSVTLETNEYIPGDNADAIKYYISLNNGVTWHQIHPTHRAYQGIYKYYINNDSIENLLSTDNTNKRTKNLTIPEEAKRIQLKIEMTRPEGIDNPEYCSPIVYQYKLKLTTGGENIEY